jgi:microcystin-dependent protein
MNNYIGEIRLWGANFAPQDWAMCDGQVLAIAGNEALFQLIGTTYGGDGTTTFALPDLRGRMPVHRSSTALYQLGFAGGTEAVALNSSQIPFHNHPAYASSGIGHLSEATAGIPAAHRDYPAFDQGAAVAMAPGSAGTSGNSQPHENMPPFLTVNFIIALIGVFPSQN